jgi:hypothetical protein
LARPEAVEWQIIAEEQWSSVSSSHCIASEMFVCFSVKTGSDVETMYWFSLTRAPACARHADYCFVQFDWTLARLGRTG